MFLELPHFNLFFSETHRISKVLAGQSGKDRPLEQSTTDDCHFCYPDSNFFFSIKKFCASLVKSCQRVHLQCRFLLGPLYKARLGWV